MIRNTFKLMFIKHSIICADFLFLFSFFLLNVNFFSLTFMQSLGSEQQYKRLIHFNCKKQMKYNYLAIRSDIFINQVNPEKKR